MIHQTTNITYSLYLQTSLTLSFQKYYIKNKTMSHTQFLHHNKADKLQCNTDRNIVNSVSCVKFETM
jgi:hypothetical protein